MGLIGSYPNGKSRTADNIAFRLPESLDTRNKCAHFKQTVDGFKLSGLSEGNYFLL